ncbi:tetratricopeptide repeat protein [bacterium]|nr:tetratricopeptide repeat protein [bacterium]
MSKSDKQSINSSRRAKPENPASATSKSTGTTHGPGWENSSKVIPRHFKTALHLESAGRFKAAISQYQKILEKKNVSPEQTRDALTCMANLYCSDNQWSQAITAFRRLQMQESCESIKAQIGCLIAKCQNEAGDWEAAIITYTEIFRNFPLGDWSAEVRLEWGKALKEAKRFEEALAIFSGLVNDNQGGYFGGDALLFMGACYEKMGNQAAARQVYQTVMDEYPPIMHDEAHCGFQRLNTRK